MLAILYKWIIGNFHQCDHEYEVYDKHKNIYGKVSYVNKCKKCGNMKTYSAGGN